MSTPFGARLAKRVAPKGEPASGALRRTGDVGAGGATPRQMPRVVPPSTAIVVAVT